MKNLKWFNKHFVLPTCLLLALFVGTTFAADIDIDADNDSKVDDTYLDLSHDITGVVYCDGAGDCTALAATATEINTPLDGATVTLTEFQELQTIDATTVSAAQWGYVGGADQALKQADNPTFGDLTVDSLIVGSDPNPHRHYDVTDADDTDWWTGVDGDADASSDDPYEIRRSSTPGNSVDFRIKLIGSTFVSQDYEELQMPVIEWTTDAATGDGKFYFHVGRKIAGLNLVHVHGEVITAGISAVAEILDIDLYNVTQTADILSTNLTIDSTETGSDTAAIPAVISGAEDDMTENDVIRIDIDVIHTGTTSKGLSITLGFDIP